MIPSQRIQNISFYGEKRENPIISQSADDILEVKQSYVVGSTTRGNAERQKITLEDNDVVEFIFEDTTTWICNPNSLDDVFPEAAVPVRSADGYFEIPLVLRSPNVERGVVSDIVLKVINVFTKKKVENAVNALAKNLERKQLENQSGLYRIDKSFNLVPYTAQVSDKPYLLLLHGTGSSTKGSFAELAAKNGNDTTTTTVWDNITANYGNNILGFQHETLSKSPLENVVDLIKQLPQVAELHLVSHSRGGLIGDILSRFCNSNENERGFDENEIKYLNTAKRDEDLANINTIKSLLADKKIIITRFVRVACPANGTILASKRLDYFFNILLNLIGYGTGIAATPVYSAFKNLIAAVIDTKNNADGLPGIEAMNPDSPFIKVLNSPGTTIEIDNPLMVISGNCKTSFSLKALLIIASKLFYFTDNDLVVNTLSMYAGSKRKDTLKYLFDENKTVDHFHYFKNETTTRALLAALRGDSNLAVFGFKTEAQKTLAERERNAIINAEGGSVFTNTVTGTKPIVVLLPGIMGSNLALDGESLWINYLNFIRGNLVKLDIKNKLNATSLVGTSYRRLVQYLQISYDVVTFPYDWRLPLTDAADKFNDTIEDLLKKRQAIKIIGHSMGGVLVRDFILKHEDTWNQLNKLKDFRLIFLGAPLGGSFRIPAVLFGQDPIINKLSKIDIFHTKQQLLEIFSQMPGLLSLLPLTVNGNDFAAGTTWKTMALDIDDWPLPVKDGEDLNWFKTYRENVLDKLEKIDYTNVVYIAGKDKATPCAYQIEQGNDGTEELVFLSTAEGDQSVTWESGIPKKMIEKNLVYYVPVSHGTLANEPAIFDGIADILSKGATNKLSRNRPVVRGEEKVFKSPDRHDFDLSENGVEKTLLGLDAQETNVKVQTKIPLQVSVTNGHLKYAAFPVLAGHFLGDGILNAENEIDRMLNGALSERHLIGLYPGEIGSSEVIIAGDNSLTGGIIVGLGKFNELTAFQLTKTVEQGIARYLLDVNSRLSFKNNPNKGVGQSGISALLIGSGYGGLSIENSIRAIIRGIQNANAKLDNMHNGQMKLIQQIEFIELYEDRALSCFYVVNKLESDDSEAVKISINKKEIKKTYGARKRIPSESSEAWWNRITVTLDKYSADNVRLLQFSLYTGAAREEKKDLYINPEGIESMISDSSIGNLWTPKLAKTLFEILIPVDFKEQLKRQGNINWILDKNTASYPWELLQDNSDDAKPLSVNAGMIRQLGTMDYRLRINSVAAASALVVAEPKLDGYLTALPGAYNEGKAVADIIEQNGFSVTPLLNSNARDILQELHSGYKIIHLAGHGTFNKDSPQHSGMVIGKGLFLTSSDIGNMSTVPELVFVNCCHLGRTDGGAETYYRNVYKMAANIGTQLIENGVKAVIAAGWAVNDTAALRFAQLFYQNMFDGECFGDAVKKAREAVYGEYGNTNTWGAYQCYGDPFYRFRNDTKPKKKKEKEFVISEEAEIEFDNLRSKVKAGKFNQEDMEEELAAISRAVDKAGIRQANITEREALLYADIYRYDLAITKFESLLSMEKADFSVSTLEKYCNIRMKKCAADYIKATQGGDKPNGTDLTKWRQIAESAIQGLESLLLISSTAERYNLLGSAYKRKGILYSDGEKQQACIKAAYYYNKAHEKGATYNKAYAITNWYAMESLLELAGNLRWGKQIKYDEADGYILPDKNDVIKKLQDITDAYKADTRIMDYWTLIEVPNSRLCLLVVNPDIQGEEAWDNVLDAYREVWDKAGSKGDKFAEIEHLQLVSDALTLSDSDNARALKERIEKLKAALEKMI